MLLFWFGFIPLVIQVRHLVLERMKWISGGRGKVESEDSKRVISWLLKKERKEREAQLTRKERLNVIDYFDQMQMLLLYLGFPLHLIFSSPPSRKRESLMILLPRDTARHAFLVFCLPPHPPLRDHSIFLFLLEKRQVPRTWRSGLYSLLQFTSSCSIWHLSSLPGSTAHQYCDDVLQP